MISGLPINLETCRRTVADFLHSRTTTSDIMDKIFRVVSTRYKVSPDDIKGKSRKENIATARHISVYLARQQTDLSLSAIGAYYDRDHTTIMNSSKTVEKTIHDNSAFAFEVEELIREINS
jgi:chromosomal replication initiator protein